MTNIKSNFWANIVVVFNYLKSDLVKKQRTFKIGFITIFLVVFFFTILLNAITMSPVIFLKLAENQVGEQDIIMTPLVQKQDVKDLIQIDSENVVTIPFFITDPVKQNNSTSSKIQLLDFDDLYNKLIDFPIIQGLAPRWLFVANATESLRSYWAVSNLLVLDSRLENEFGFGRNLKLENLGILVV